MEVIEVRNKEDYSKKLNPGILRDSFNIYVRVSTKDQIENTSLDNQRDIGIKYYNTHQKGNYKYVVVWREEGKSGDDVVTEDSVGDIVTRELLSTIINHWEDGNIKNLWVYDLSRLSRNTDTSMVIKSKMYKYGINYFENNHKYNFDDKMEKLMFSVLSSFNEFENTLRFEKGLMGKRRILDNNKWWGGPLPIGYMKDENNRLVKDETIIKNRKGYQWIELMFKEISKGKSVIELKRLLERIGFKTNRGNEVWNENSLRLILRNRIYIGELHYEVKGLKGKSKEYCRKKGLITKHIVKTERIVSNELFNDVQKKLNVRRRFKKPTINEYLLNGLLRCGSCGEYMSGRVNKKRNINVYSCVSNPNKWRDNRKESCNQTKSINIPVVEFLVWNQVIDTFEKSERIKQSFRDKYLTEYIEDNKKIKQQISNIKKQIKNRYSKLEKVESRRDKIYDDYLDIKISEERFNVLNLKIDENIKLISDEISKRESEIEILKRETLFERWFTSFNNHLSEIKSYTTLEQKKKFLNDYVKKIEIHWDDITSTHRIKIFFHLNIVKDRGNKVGEYVYKITKGKSVSEITGINSNKLSRKLKKINEKNTSFNNHSTVTDCVLNEVTTRNNSLLFNENSINITFEVNFITSNLTKIHHYNSRQKELYNIVCLMRDVEKKTYKEISDYLTLLGYKSIRTNNNLLPQYVYSIYTKGKIRENRLNKKFDSFISNVSIY